MGEYFVLRLDRIDILDNREWGDAEVKIISFVTTGNNDLPMLDGYSDTDDHGEKRELIKDAAAEIVSSRDFTEVENVKDDAILTFGEVGVALYTAYTIPIDINWSLTLIERDADIRQVGQQLTELVDSDGFNSFTDEIIETVAGEANPGLKIAFKVTKFFAQRIGSTLANNRDDQIGMYIESLNKYEHYRNGKWNRENQRGVNGNIYVDYSIFCTSNPGGNDAS